MEFSHIFNKDGNRFWPGHTVNGFTEYITKLVRLTVIPSIPNINNTYNLVLIAVGFGAEIDQSRFKSTKYWQADNLERIRDLREAENFVVSGCGDGGLIDALRIVHRDFKRGIISFRVAAETFGTNLASIIQNAESKAIRDRDSSTLKAAYEAAALALISSDEYKDLQLFLSDSLEAFGGIVDILDEKLTSPYSLNAAPINKLLVAHAIKSGRIKFNQGTVKLAKGEILIAGTHLPRPPRTKVIVRHGAKPNFGSLLSDPEIADLKRRQELLADYHAEPEWEGTFPSLPGQPPHDIKSQEFIFDRLPKAKRAVRFVSEDASVAEDIQRYRIVYSKEPPYKSPTRLFGVQTISETRPRALLI